MSAQDMPPDLLTQYKGRILEARNLPALPAAVTELNRLMKDPNSSSDQAAKVIERDQALAAKVLRMVNSPIYGFPGRISNIRHTLMLLGMNVIRSVIISSAVFDIMNKTMLGLWEHSVASSLAAVETARAAGLPHPEEYAVMGLLHDIGKVVFSMQIPEAKQEVDKLVKNEDLFSMEAEKRLLGFGHDRINAWVCEHWNLPLPLKEAMIYHHAPSLARFHP
ncbi:MAG: HDOD domain-containing protein, partial [Deltaproteobacteria bacterium]|nr:HDOD domain-containing protein [Deltaproteobacteria bacterium]